MQSLVITNVGEELTAKLIAETETVTFTRIAASDHAYSEADIKELTELADIRQTALISNVSRTDRTVVEVLAAMDNTELEEGYYIRTLGVYAEDSQGREILFGVSIEPDYPSYLPPYSGKTISSVTYQLYIKVNNSEQVVIELNPGAYPTVEQMEHVQKMVLSHTEENVYGDKGSHGLRYLNDEFQVLIDGEWEDSRVSKELAVIKQQLSGLSFEIVSALPQAPKQDVLYIITGG